MKMTRIIPMLPVRSMPASVEFYGKLGFSVEKRVDEWRWAMLVYSVVRRRQGRLRSLWSFWRASNAAARRGSRRGVRQQPAGHGSTRAQPCRPAACGRPRVRSHRGQ